MPYTHVKQDGKVIVKKKDTGKVVGHTTPEKLPDYMAALHMHEKGYAYGGVVDEEDITTPETDMDIPPTVPVTPPIPGAVASPGLTAEDRANLYKELEKKRHGVGAVIGDALAGYGDAIARGPGRTNTNFLGATLEAQRQKEQQGLQAFDVERAQNIADTNQKLQNAMKQNEFNLKKQAQDSASDYSKARQKSFSPILRAAGYTDEEIGAIPGADIDNVAKNATSFADAKAKAELMKSQQEMTNEIRKQQAEIEKQRADTEKTRAASEAAHQSEVEKQAALEKLNREGIIHRMNPMNWKARSALEQSAGLTEPPAQAVPPALPASVSPAPNVLTATNPKTGHKIRSLDGGKTWQ